MRRVLFGGIVFSSVAIATTAAFGVGDPIEVRQKIMTSVGASSGLLFRTVRGELDFNDRAVRAALAALQAASATIGDYFPEGSETGGQTCASPKIWEDRPGFDAIVAKFVERSSAAFSARPTDVETLKAATDPVFELCGECHKVYRAKEELSDRC